MDGFRMQQRPDLPQVPAMARSELDLRSLNRLSYLPNVAIRVIKISRPHAPWLIGRPLKEVDASLN